MSSGPRTTVIPMPPPPNAEAGFTARIVLSASGLAWAAAVGIASAVLGAIVVPVAFLVAALSLAIATRVEDPERDVRGLPVRLRGKAMGLSPAAFEMAFARQARTVVEDSEATIRLLAEGLTVWFDNGDVRSAAYDRIADTPRPGHAGLVARQKFGGFNDPRGGGHFSGRLTAGLVAAGVVADGLALADDARDRLRRPGSPGARG